MSLPELVLPNDPLRKKLSQLSGKIVRYFPKSGNLGDGFITYATLHLFREYNIKFTSHRQFQRFDNEIILIGGGGNLIEGRYDDVARLIWEHRENNEIILLPHTIVGYDDLLKETYNNLTVFCRENISYTSVLESGANPERVHLSHDMTFFLPDNHFKQRNANGRGVLNAFRRDGESLNKKSPQNIPNGNIDISLAWNGDLWTNSDFVDSATTSMADFISQYECVSSDRLHVSIMSSFLDRQVNFYPNEYFKNEAVFEHSIKERFPNTKFRQFAEQEEGRNLVPSGQVPQVDWKARFERAQDERSKVARQLIAANQTITELDGEIVQLKRHSDESAGQYLANEEEFRQKHAQLEEDLAESKSECVRLKEHNQEIEKNYEKKCSELHNEVSHLTGTIRDLYNSTSWRITKPVRAIKRVFAGRG